MRITEVARVLVSDLLMPSGTMRKEVSLRAEITKGCRQRCIFLTHDLVVAALDRYIEYRWAKGWGTEFDRKKYRGLCPETAMIFTHKGSAFELTTKRRILIDGKQEDYQAADALQNRVTTLFRSAGLSQCTSHSGRRTFATRLVAQGHPIEVVQRLLGHASIDCTDAYLAVSDDTLCGMFESAI